MLHIPAHKATENPPGQWINPDARRPPPPELREPPPKPYQVEPPPKPTE
jgi:hypothetical protein